MSNFLNTIIRRSINIINYQTNKSLLFSKLISKPKPIHLFLQTNFIKFYQFNRNRFFCNSTKAFDVNTNVSKDVILYKYDNERFFKILNIFAFCQFIFWNYLSHFSFTTLKDAPIAAPLETDAWYRQINLGENKYRNGITVVCFLIGYGILAAIWMFTLRSVRYLVLLKGGKDLSIVTYGPFNKNRIMNVPLKFVSAQESRELAKVQLPIKIKNRSLYYILDMKGEFKNTKLFDYTAGLRRKI